MGVDSWLYCNRSLYSSITARRDLDKSQIKSVLQFIIWCFSVIVGVDKNVISVFCLYTTVLLADWLTDWGVEWLTDWLIDWMSDCLTAWLTDWLTNSLTDWMTDTHPVSPLLNHSLTYSLTHSQTHSFIRTINIYLVSKKDVIDFY